MQSEQAPDFVKPHPYPDRSPVPLGVSVGRIEYKWMKFKCSKLPSDYPYRVPMQGEKYQLCNAVLYGDTPPIAAVCGEPGDVWLSFGQEKGIWINHGAGTWASWGGNVTTHKHPYFTDHALWFNGQSFCWAKEDSVRGSRSRWRRGIGRVQWMQDQGEDYKENGGDFKLGDSSDAVQQWLHFRATNGVRHVAKREANGEAQTTSSNKKRRVDVSRPTAEDNQPVFPLLASLEGLETLPPEPNETPPPTVTLLGGAPRGATPAGKPGNSGPLRFPELEPTYQEKENAPGGRSLTSPETDRPYSEQAHRPSGARVADGAVNYRGPSPNVQAWSVIGERAALDRALTEDAASDTAFCDLSLHSADKPGSEARDVHPAFPPFLTPSPTYPGQLTNRCCLDGREGVEWPKGSEMIKWWNGLETVLPFVRDKTKKMDRDVRAVKDMASGPSATGEVEGFTPPVVIVRVEERHFQGLSGLTSNSGASFDDTEVMSRIEGALSANKCVVVVPWTADGPRLEFDEVGVKSLRGSLDQPVTWTCAKKRVETRDESDAEEEDEGQSEDTNITHRTRRASLRPKRKASRKKASSTNAPQIHRTTTLREFLKLTDEPNCCGNLLDAPEIEGEAPWFIRRLSKDIMAWKTTQQLGFSNGTKGSSKPGVTDPAMSSSQRAEQDAFKVPVGKMDDGLGPQAVPFDCMRMRRWQLLTMAGFYSYLHHDANGLCTWATIRAGAKLWCIRELRTELLKGGSLAELMGLHESAMKAGWNAVGTDQYAAAYNLFLCEGSVLIMPPGKWHDVYTPVKIIAQGGHFLSYRTMHLTQFSRWFDHTFALEATNADHIGVLRTLCRMVIALVHTADGITRRQFLSLAHMVMEPQSYTAPVVQNQPQPAFFLLQEDEDDRKEALRIIRAICHANGIRREDVRNESLKGGKDWENVGKDSILVPSLSEMKKTKLQNWY